MAELIHAYNLDGTVLKTDERNVLLKEQQEQALRWGEPEFSVASIYALVKNSRDELYVQLRGDKDENPHMYDKSVSGHVLAGQTPEQALIRKAKHELGVDVILASEDYLEVLAKTDTTKTAVVRLLGYIPNFRSMRQRRDGGEWIKLFDATVYGGVYDGPVAFSDGEVEGMQLIPLAIIKDVMAANPGRFTHDLSYLIDRYGANL